METFYIEHAIALLYPKYVTWLVLAQHKNDIFMHIPVFAWYVPYIIGLKDYIIVCIYGQLYQLLVRKICMQWYIVTMTMNIINIVIKID